MSRPIVYAAAALLLLFVVIPAATRTASPIVLAQPVPSTDLFSQSGGAMNCAATSGDIVWLCSGPRLLAVDVSDPADPKVLGQSDVLPGVLNALVLDESRNMAWVMTKDQVVGLDLTAVGQPKVLGQVHVGGNDYGRQSMALAGRRIWLHGSVAGTVLGVDVGDPASPLIVNSVDIRSQTGGAVVALAARGERLYVLARVGSHEEPVGGRNLLQNQIQVFDLSFGAVALRVQTVRVPNEHVTEDGDLTWDGDLLWVRNHDNRLLAWLEDAQTLALTLVISGELGGCYSPVGFTIREGRAFASCTTGFADNLAVEVFDLRQGPEFPLVAKGAGAYDDPGLYSPAIALVDTTLWITDGAGRLRGLSVGTSGDIPDLRHTGTLRLVGEVDELTWDADRQRLLATASDGLMPIDVTDPQRPAAGPVLAGGFHMGQLDADGDRLAMEKHGDGDMISPGLQARDLRDPVQAPLVFEANYPDLRLLSGPSSPVSLDGTNLLLAETSASGGRMSHWEWLPGAAPRRIAYWPASNWLEAMALGAGQAAMVSVDISADEITEIMLSVIELRTRAVRDLVLPIPASESVQVDLQFSGDALWLALANSGANAGSVALTIQRIDLADPSGLRANTAWEESLVGSYVPSIQLLTDRSGAHLLLGQSPGRVRVFVSRSGTLHPLAILDSPFRISDLAINPDGDRLFIAAFAGGLISYQRPAAGWESLPTPLPPTVAPTVTMTPTSTPSPTATATMVVRSRGWLPWIGRP